MILTRDSQGRRDALLNMCRHRGNCGALRLGNARHFMCTYSRLDLRQRRYGDMSLESPRPIYNALDRSSLGLIEARVDTYAGIVRHLGSGCPEPRGYLGDARWYLDTVFVGGTVACRPSAQ